MKLGSQELPMFSDSQFFAFFGSVLLLGPETPSPVSAQPAVRQSYVKLVQAAIAFWHFARGGRRLMSTGLRAWGSFGQVLSVFAFMSVSRSFPCCRETVAHCRREPRPVTGRMGSKGTTDCLTNQRLFREFQRNGH